MARSIYITSDDTVAFRVGRERYKNGPCTLTVSTSENYPDEGKTLVAVLHRDAPGGKWSMTMGDKTYKFTTEKSAVLAMFSVYSMRGKIPLAS